MPLCSKGKSIPVNIHFAHLSIRKLSLPSRATEVLQFLITRFLSFILILFLYVVSFSGLLSLCYCLSADAITKKGWDTFTARFPFPLGIDVILCDWSLAIQVVTGLCLLLLFKPTVVQPSTTPYPFSFICCYCLSSINGWILKDDKIMNTLLPPWAK